MEKKELAWGKKEREADVTGDKKGELTVTLFLFCASTYLEYHLDSTCKLNQIVFLFL